MERHEVSFDSDGTSCAAWFYSPSAPSPCPIIVMGHGLGGTREIRLDAYAEKFCAGGYACLVIDYRFFGGSEGQPRGLINPRKQLQDFSAAIDYARSRPDVDPDRVVVWGSSFGGGHAITTAASDHRIAAAIAQAPFTDGVASSRVMSPWTTARLTWRAIRDVVGSQLGLSPVLVPYFGPPHSGALMTAPDVTAGYLALLPPGMVFDNNTPARVVLQIPIYRPVRHAKKVTCPILFCVCEQDSVAPPGPTVRAAHSAPLGEVCRYDAGHFDIYVGELFEQTVSDQLDFLRRHVPV